MPVKTKGITMYRKIFCFFAVVFSVLPAVAFAAGSDTAPDSGQAVTSAVPAVQAAPVQQSAPVSDQSFYADKFCIAYNGGLDFRWWFGKNWGLEIPISGSTTGSLTKADISEGAQNSFYWNAVTGLNFIFPLQNIYGINFNFIPGIYLSGSENLYRNAPSYWNSNNIFTYYEQDSYNYSFSGGISLGLEAEVFPHNICDKIPQNISFGSKFAFNCLYNYAESWNHYPGMNQQIQQSNPYSSFTAFQRNEGIITNFSIGGSTWSALYVRYYF